MPGLRLRALGNTDNEAIRIETFRSREYTVVPVIALVEQVLQGLNAEEPEFAPASEFGKFPMTWNGRPVTMDHPRRNGVLCSANDPDILEEYAFGFLANTVLDGTKLKTEAWLDNALIAEKGGEFQATLDRIGAGEVMVEVSTGLFCDVVKANGTYDGVKYKREWENVVPDHLAFLPEGTIGACSVADGCGVPRLNAAQIQQAKASGAIVAMASPLKISREAAPCCDACAKGDSCMANKPHTHEGGSDEHSNTNNTNNATTTAGEIVSEEPANQPGSGEGAAAQSTGTEEGAGESGSEGSSEGVSGEAPAATETQPASEGTEKPGTPDQAAAELEANAERAAAFERLTANALASGVTFENARTIVQQALSEKWPAGATSDCGCCYYGGNWIVAMTADQVAFERRDSNYNYHTVAVEYSIDENGGVTFTGEPVPVNLMVTITPKPDTNTAVTANEGASGANQQQKEGQMADETQTAGAGGENRANGAGEAAAPRTLSDYLNEAPPEMREMLQESLDMRAQARTKLIKEITTNSDVFTEDDLKDRSMDELRKLATMSRPKIDYSGRPTFGEHGNTRVNAGEPRDNQRTVPAAPKAFEAKPTRRADYSNDSAAA